MSFHKLCRSCMKEVELWELKNVDESLVEMFIFCAQVQISIEDTLPKLFCRHCTKTINSSYIFIRKAQEVDEVYKNIFYNNSSIKSKLKINIDPLKKNNKVTVKNENDNEINDKARPSIFCKSVQTRNKTKIKRKQHEPNAKSQETVDTNDNISDNNDFEIDTIDEIEISQNKQAKVWKKYRQNDNATEIVDKKSNNHKDERIICPICSKPFSRTTQKWFKKHLKSHYKKKKVFKTNETGYECLKCQKAFKSQTWYTKHVQREHSLKMETQKLVCPFCTKIFETKGQLRYHVDANHEESKKHVCNACEKRFRLQKQLAVHVLSHSSERPYICDTCHMSFKMKHVLVNHMAIHENRKAFLCSFCGRGFSSLHNLQEHTRTHTGEKPFSCKQCGFRSAQKVGLLRHQLTHTNHRRYLCDYCQKSFFDNGGLKKHVRIHTGERPYKCPQCPLAFITSWKRKLHLMKLHQLGLEEIPKLMRDGALAISDNMNTIK